MAVFYPRELRSCWATRPAQSATLYRGDVGPAPVRGVLCNTGVAVWDGTAAAPGAITWTKGRMFGRSNNSILVIHHGPCVEVKHDWWHLPPHPRRWGHDAFILVVHAFENPKHTSSEQRRELALVEHPRRRGLSEHTCS